MARREEIALQVVRGLVRRPRLANAVFRFDKWIDALGPYGVDETRLRWKTSLAFRSPTQLRLDRTYAGFRLV